MSQVVQGWTMDANQPVDTLTIRRVANGWIIEPGRGAQEFTHVATDPQDLADHVLKWSKAQLHLVKP